MSTDLRRTAEHWTYEGAWQAGRGIYWAELTAVQERLNSKASGDHATDWGSYTLARHFSDRLPLDRCLSLGCGEGGLERSLAAVGAFTACDACDIASASIATAQRLAEVAGYRHIRYEVRDLNRLALPPASYDAVWASGAVHHVRNLEGLFEQVAQALRPSGLFVLNEYIGASRFQFGPRQREVIQACFRLLPEAYRRITAATLAHDAETSQRRNAGWLLRRGWDKLRDRDLLPAIRRRLRLGQAQRTGARPALAEVSLPTARSVIAVDPSEAVRSAEIMPLLRQRFEIVECRPLGGALLQFLLAGIAGNFQDEAGERLLEMLFGIEDALMAAGDLDSDFACIVAAPRGRS